MLGMVNRQAKSDYLAFMQNKLLLSDSRQYLVVPIIFHVYATFVPSSGHLPVMMMLFVCLFGSGNNCRYARTPAYAKKIVVGEKNVRWAQQNTFHNRKLMWHNNMLFWYHIFLIYSVAINKGFKYVLSKN